MYPKVGGRGLCKGKGGFAANQPETECLTNQPETECVGLSLLLTLALSSPIMGWANQVVGLARKRRSGPEEKV